MRRLPQTQIPRMSCSIASAEGERARAVAVGVVREPAVRERVIVASRRIASDVGRRVEAPPGAEAARQRLARGKYSQTAPGQACICNDFRADPGAPPAAMMRP